MYGGGKGGGCWGRRKGEDGDERDKSIDHERHIIEGLFFFFFASRQGGKKRPKFFLRYSRSFVVGYCQNPWNPSTPLSSEHTSQ